MATYEHNSAKFGYMSLDSLEGVQDALEKLGYAPGPADGKDGPQTQKAVRSFQTDAHIAVDGKVGKETREALVEVLNNTAKRTEAPS